MIKKISFSNIWIGAIFLVILLLTFPLVTEGAYALEKIAVTTVDPAATGFGTFQSHNQKVVSNQYGIFMTHLRARNEAYDQNTWRLSRSTDGGKTFSTIYESTNGTSAPVIETDGHGTIYLAHPDWGVGFTGTNAYLYRFTPENNFTNPTKTVIPGSAAGKYAMMIDVPRGQLYFLAHNGTFSILGLNGDVKKNYLLLTGGSSAYQQYPYLYLDINGDLYVAWTTLKKDQYMYWDIHFMRSKDGGITWQEPNGQTLPLPIVADETGPTDRITLDDEFDVHTWLWTLIVKNGKAHFAYMAQFPSPNTRQHYIRYDMATARKDLDIYPEWKGETISFLNLDGFCTTRVSQSDFPIYCISRTRDSYLGVLVSYDNGQTWHDYAQSDFNDQNLYSIGGAREITADGYIIGSYTDPGTDTAVRFFKIKVVPPTGTLILQNFQNTNNTISISYSNPFAHPSDWIGLFPVDSASNGWKDWKWLNNSQTTPQNVDSSGNITLASPDTSSYEVRYYTRDYDLASSWKLLDSKAVTSNSPTPTPTYLQGDINQDGKVDVFDYNLLMADYGKSGQLITDITGDGKVNLLDAAVVITNFGKSL